MTGDKRNLEVAPYVVWRVADPVVFLRAVGEPRAGRGPAHERVLRRAERCDRPPRPGRPGLDRRGPLGARRADEGGRWAVAPAARSELGVEVLDVRLRRFGHPVEVRPAVFDLIRSERRQVAARLRAEGEAQYLTITSQADRARDTILAEAEAEAERVRGNAEAEATRLLNEAHARDPQFFEFLRTLESYRSILDGQTTVVLSASSPLLKLLTQGPAAGQSSDVPGQSAQVKKQPASHDPPTRYRASLAARPPHPRPSGARGDSHEDAFDSGCLLSTPPSLLFVGSGVCLVAPGEVVVVRRLGRLIDPTWGPGLHWRYPLGSTGSIGSWLSRCGS